MKPHELGVGSVMITKKASKVFLETEIMLQSNASDNLVSTWIARRSCRKADSDSADGTRDSAFLTSFPPPPHSEAKEAGPQTAFWITRLYSMKRREKRCLLLGVNSWVFQHLLSTCCVSNTVLCVTSTMLKIMTEKAKLLNSSIVSIFTSHNKFHAEKRKTEGKRKLWMF